MTDWLISTPAWGTRCVDAFVEKALPAIKVALKEVSGRARFMVHTDQPHRILDAIGGNAMVRAVPEGTNAWDKAGKANREAAAHANAGEAVAFINADMVPSREVFAASERRFAEGKRLIMMAASRTLGGEPPIGATSAELLDWTMEHRHPAIEQCFWGTGRSIIPWAIYFQQGDDIVLRGFHLHPFALVKDRDLVFQGTIDLDMPDNFRTDEVHLITDRHEASFAELSPPERIFPLFPLPFTGGDIVHWARRSTTPLHRWMFRQRIVIKGSGADTGDMAICDEISHAI